MFIYFALFSSSSCSYILFLHHVLPVLHICIVGSSSGWSHHLAFGLLRRLTSWTAKFMDFIAYQLVKLFGAHFATDQLVGLLGA